MYYSRALRLITTLICMAFLFLHTACKKNVPGPKGDPGTPGKPGNLKQTAIGPIKILSSSWAQTPDYSWETVLFINEITKEVIDRGEVKLYLEADTQWNVLPYANGYFFMQYTISQNTVRLQNITIHGGLVPKPPDANYRIVIFSPA